MRDNGKTPEWQSHSHGSGGAGQIKPVHWTRTEHQVAAHESFAPGTVVPRGEVGLTTDGSPTMLLAVPPKWTHRDDLPCVQRLPRGNERDPYDTSDPNMAKALCAGCPVKRECLEAALVEEEGLSGRSRYLVRGGYTPWGRSKLPMPVVRSD